MPNAAASCRTSTAHSSLTAACICLSLLLSFATPVGAAVMVLLHGHLGYGAEWHDSGFTDKLIEAGWQDGGQLTEVDGRIRNTQRVAAKGPQTFYTMDLASETSLLTQSAQLGRYLAAIRAHHPGETYTLVGFSAGGVVARLYIVRHPEFPVDALISLASPHTGTESAEIGLIAGETPLADYAEMFGIEFINHSRDLYRDLVRERPGTLLYELNRQPHPDIGYLSLVRVNGEAEIGDLVVPAHSQDMNNVVALKGRSKVKRLPGVHGVLASDADSVLNFIRDLKQL